MMELHLVILFTSPDLSITNLTAFFDDVHSPVQEVQNQFFKGKNLKLYVKREDLLHPVISGNKFRKLKYNLYEAKKLNIDTLLTFGGYYSNHLYAVAAAGQIFGFNTIGIVRGEYPKIFNETLTFAQDAGMQLDFIDRTSYRNKSDDVFIKSLNLKYGDFYCLPEGGTNALAVKGATEILTSQDYSDYDYIFCCTATGGTLAGIIEASEGKSQIVGVSVLKGNFLHDEVKKLIPSYRHPNWKIINDYHFGGYAKTTPMLTQFIQNFINETKITIEFVYSAKMFYAIHDLTEKQYFKPGSKILAIHTGGLRQT